MVVRVHELTFPFPLPLLLPLLLLLLLCEGFFKEVKTCASLDSFLFFSSSSRPRPPFLNFQKEHGASQHAPRT